MAKRKRPASAVTGLMDAMLAEARKKSGCDFFTGAEAEARIFGIPLPALCLRWLFQSTVYPLGRIMMVAGRQESLKSAFSVEVIRWHRRCGGAGSVFGTESKDAPDLRQSILEHDEKACSWTPCESLERWQEALSGLISAARRVFVENPEEATVTSLALVVDSLYGARAVTKIDKVRDLGYAEKDYGAEARLIGDFLGVYHPMIDGTPMSLVFTNHLKDAMTQGGYSHGPSTTTPGGKSIKFYETFELEMAGIADLDWSKFSGRRVRFITRKNSLGQGRKKLEAEMLWWYEYDSGVQLQKTVWDWDKATIELLLSLMGVKNKNSEQRKLLAGLLDLHEVSGGAKGKLIWSDALGVPRDNAVSYRRAGQLLEDRSDLLAAIQPLIGIRERRVYEPVADYLSVTEGVRTVFPGDAVEGLDAVSADVGNGDGFGEVEEDEVSGE